MLKIYTDLTDNNWLTYILDEFKRISGAKFSIQLSKPGEAEEDGENALFYSTSPKHPNTIADRSAEDQGELILISDGLYAFENTIADKSEFLLPCDIFRNAFLILSRKEEYNAELKGRRIRSYSSRHPRKYKDSFSLPLVNIYFKKLEEIVKGLFPALEFDNELNFKIDLSHDVDYIRKTPQLLLKQTAFNTYNLVKSIIRPAEFLKNLRTTIRFPFISYTYNCFDYWKDLESKHGLRSVFYVYVKTRGGSFKKWLIDPSYNITKNTSLQNKLKELSEDGFEIGLHGSLKSAIDDQSLNKEKEQLERVMGQPVERVRQHWLNYDEIKTPYAHNALFKFDSTLGWNDRMGFRSGCASKYRPWDHIHNRAFEYFVIPQILMDSNIFDYSKVETAKEEAFNMLKSLKKYKNVNASISWHYRTCSKDYKWHHVYEEIINECL